MIDDISLQGESEEKYSAEKFGVYNTISVQCRAFGIEI